MSPYSRPLQELAAAGKGLWWVEAECTADGEISVYITPRWRLLAPLADTWVMAFSKARVEARVRRILPMKLPVYVLIKWMDKEDDPAWRGATGWVSIVYEP